MVPSGDDTVYSVFEPIIHIYNIREELAHSFLHEMLGPRFKSPPPRPVKNASMYILFILSLIIFTIAQGLGFHTLLGIRENLLYPFTFYIMNSIFLTIKLSFRMYPSLPFLITGPIIICLQSPLALAVIYTRKL